MDCYRRMHPERPVCDTCGTPIVRTPYRRKNKAIYFCSKACSERTDTWNTMMDKYVESTQNTPTGRPPA
jgi:endogenous inhibitor of DNA gyrase (YacG/DUF329 family)